MYIALLDHKISLITVPFVQILIKLLMAYVASRLMVVSIKVILEEGLFVTHVMRCVLEQMIIVHVHVMKKYLDAKVKMVTSVMFVAMIQDNLLIKQDVFQANMAVLNMMRLHVLNVIPVTI